MQTFECAIAANETKRFNIAGRFIRVITAVDNSLNMEWLRGGRVIGEALAVGSFFAVDTGVNGEDFDGVQITSNASQTIKFVLSKWAVEAL